MDLFIALFVFLCAVELVYYLRSFVVSFGSEAELI
jgi:hypothetical protein